MRVSLAVITAAFLGLVGCTKNTSTGPTNTVSTDDGMQLFRMNGKVYTKADLPANIQNEILEQQKRYKNGLDMVVNRYVIDTYLEEMSKKEGKTKEAYQASLLEAKEPTEKELKAFYEKNKTKIPYPYEQVKDKLKEFVGQEAAFAKQNEIVEKAKAKYGFETLIATGKAKPVEINIENRPTKGNQSAKLTVVEFADYQCHHCGDFHKGMKAVFPQIQDKVKFVFIDFPLNAAGPSSKIAIGAYCATQQGKFWEYHDLAYENQETLGPDAPNELAEKTGLDIAKFKTCTASKEAKDFVASGRQQGENAGVTGTPGIFLNGTKIDGDANALKKAIEDELKS